MRERIRQPGVAQLRQTVTKRFDEVGGWLSQRPEAKVVLDDVGRDPNPEDLSLQYSIEHAIPVALRFGWSLLAESQCVQFLGDEPLPCTRSSTTNEPCPSGRAMPICFHLGAWCPLVSAPSQAWTAPLTASRQSGMLTPTSGERIL